MENQIRNWLTQIKKGYLDLCILCLIEVANRAYGFQLLAQLEEIGISVKEGTLYPLLNRMTKDGLLESKWETENIRGNPRKFYSLTEAGKTNLQLMKTEYRSMFETFKKIKTIGGQQHGKQRA